MVKGRTSPTRATKLDALRIKKYCGYFIKQNRNKPLEWLHTHAMAQCDYLFNNRHLCSDSWCYMKQLENHTVGKTSIQSLEEGYFRCIEKDIALYNAIKVRYNKYISLDYLKLCVYELDTQLNEGMNTSVAPYTQKGIIYCTTTSLPTRVLTAAGI